MFRHPERQVVFIGDLMDRGPQQVETLEIARSMVDASTARIVLGNHEFNAVAWVTRNDAGEWCRSHRKRHQHEAFLDQVGEGSSAHERWIDWFRKIPLWLDLVELRLVHAAWSASAIDALAGAVGPADTLTPELVVRASTPGSAEHDAIEYLLKGPEIPLPPDWHYDDKGGDRRGNARFAWWLASVDTIGSAAVLPGPDDRSWPPDEPLLGPPPETYVHDVPVIVGHYWFTGEPTVISGKVACVDYSAGRDGPLVAYRWNAGNTTLHDDRFESFAG